jgi:hypothetical protein
MGRPRAPCKPDTRSVACDQAFDPKKNMNALIAITLSENFLQVPNQLGTEGLIVMDLVMCFLAIELIMRLSPPLRRKRRKI